MVTLDRGFVFAADLIRQIDVPMVCHFVRADVRDVEQAGHHARGAQPTVPGSAATLPGAVSAWSSIVSPELVWPARNSHSPTARPARTACREDPPRFRNAL